MTSKNTISGADELYVGRGYDPGVFAANGRYGVPINPLTRCVLGSPIALDTNALIVGCTSTNMPNGSSALSKTYSAATTGVAAPCNDAGAPVITTITTSTGTSATVWPLDVPRNITTTSSSAAADTIFTVTGYDVYKVKMVEAITIATGQSATAGKKAFKYVESIVISSASDVTSDTVTVGFGDVLGLPYLAAAKSDIIRVYLTGVLDDSAVVVAGDATTPSAVTGDVRGTVDPNSACDGTAVVVWIYVADHNSQAGVKGKAQYS